MIDQWLKRWGVPPAGAKELRQILAQPTVTAGGGSGSEAGVQQSIRLQCAGRLWRNNVGVLMDDRGIPVRYGLANDSSRVNRSIKSSDLIGITPITLGGVTVGVFTAIEVKGPSWKYRGTEREVAQLKYINLAQSLGGIGVFATSLQDYTTAIQEFKKQW